MNFVNNTDDEIWLGVIGDDFTPQEKGWGFQHGFPGPNGSAANNWKNSWHIAPHSTLTWCAPKVFSSARFWPRTGCSLNSAGIFTCKTGDCLKDTKTTPAGDLGNDICRISGTTNSTGSVVEFTINSPNSPQNVYYDLSFVDGYDFPIEIKPLKATSKCPPTLGCQTLPNTCYTDPNGAFVGGICPAPYIAYNHIPTQKYEDGSTAISAKCADPAADICGCAVNCDGVEGRVPVLPNCPDTFTLFNPYTGVDVLLKSSGCSPVNKFVGVGATKAQDIDPKRFASFWNQTPCDPVTGEGSFFAPYEFDFAQKAPAPQGKRAMFTIRPNGAWEKAVNATPQITINTDDFHAYGDVGNKTAVDLTSVDISKHVTVYVDKNDIPATPGNDPIPHDIKALEPNKRTVRIDTVNKVLTVTISDDSDFIGKNYPVTVNIANKAFACNPWKDEFGATYVSELHKQCPGAYTWQYDDLVGLGSCTDNDPKAVEQFEITFHPRPAKALKSGDFIEFAPQKGLKLNLTLKSNGNKQIPVIGEDMATIALSDQDQVAIQASNCRTVGNKAYAAPVCTLTYNQATQSFTVAEADAWCGQFKSITNKHVGISSPDPVCLPLWDGKNITVYPIKGSAFNLKALDSEGAALKEWNLSGSDDKPTDPWPMPSGKTTFNLVLTSTCSAPAPDKSVITCTAAVDIDKKTIRLTEGISYYCGTIFNGDTFSGDIRLVQPVPTYFCVDPAWTGDPLGFYGQNGQRLSVVVTGKNSINKSYNPVTVDPFYIKINNGDQLTLEQACPTPEGARLRCLGTYDRVNKKFAMLKGSDTYCSSDDFTKNLIHHAPYPPLPNVEFRWGMLDGAKCSAPPKFTLPDALTTYQIVAGEHPYSDDHKNLDVAPLGPDGKPQGDDSVGIPDVVLLLRYLVGLHTW